MCLEVKYTVLLLFPLSKYIKILSPCDNHKKSFSHSHSYSKYVPEAFDKLEIFMSNVQGGTGLSGRDVEVSNLPEYIQYHAVRFW